MILSETHKFIFVRNIKTASTSMALALKPYKRKAEDSIFYKVIRRFTHLSQVYPYYDFYHTCHTPLCRAKAIIPENLYKNLKKFGVIRDPVEWTVSVFKHCQRMPYLNIKGEKTLRLPSTVHTLKDFLIYRKDNYAPLQSLQFINIDGELDVDWIADFNSINKFAAFLATKMSITIDLPTVNISPSSQILSITPSERSMIEDACYLDYKIFDFDDNNNNGLISINKIDDTEKTKLKHELLKAGGTSFNPWRFKKA